MEVSIIIVNYNVKQLVLECIASIYKYLDCVSFEVILVDNNSADDSINAIKNVFPEIKVVANQTNEGFSQANNRGMEGAKGKYILLLNPDTYLFDSSICNLIAFVKEQGNILVAPKLLNVNRTLQPSVWKDKSLFILFQESFRYFKSAYPGDLYKTPQIVENVSGAAMLFPKQLVEKAGYFDKDMFFMEDFDICYRIRKSGMPVYYFPNASIIHIGGQSSETNANVAYSNLILSKLKFYKKHKSKLAVFLAFVITFFHLSGYTLFLLAAAPFSEKYRRRILLHFFTFKQFIRYLFTGKLPIT